MVGLMREPPLSWGSDGPALDGMGVPVRDTFLVGGRFRAPDGMAGYVGVQLHGPASWIRAGVPRLVVVEGTSPGITWK
jgi:hypothetical protein